MKTACGGDGLYVEGEPGDNVVVGREYNRADGVRVDDRMRVERADLANLVRALLMRLDPKSWPKPDDFGFKRVFAHETEVSTPELLAKHRREKPDCAVCHARAAFGLEPGGAKTFIGG